MPHAQRTLRVRSAGIAAGLTTIALAATFLTPLPVLAQASVSEAARVKQPINNDERSVLGGTHLRALDRMTSIGPVEDVTPMNHMQLMLKPSAGRSAALSVFLAAQHDPNATQFHQWIAPEEFGIRFGLVDQDIDSVRSWLREQGFTVNGVYQNKSQIDFSGNAGMIRKAFRAEERLYTIGQAKHTANSGDVSVPSALKDVVIGVAGLSDLHPRPQHKPLTVAQFDPATQKFKFPGSAPTNVSGAQPEAIMQSGVRGLVPYDLAKIYGADKLHKNGTTGKGITIAVVEGDSMNPADWYNFVQQFGLAKYGGTFAQITPQVPGFTNCVSTIPNGPADDNQETLLDAEWSTAMAPGAHVEEASCDDSDGSNFFGGVYTAALNLVNGTSRPNVISASFGFGEDAVDAASKTAIDLLWAQADAEGISVFVSSGDSGSNTDSNGIVISGIGISANALATSPNVTAVGGTDLYDTLERTTGLYFSAKLNAEYGSALSYVPEITWNESCGNTGAAKALGFPNALALCKSQATADPNLTRLTSEGSSGAPSVIDSKPAWQRLVYNAAKDQSRDIPDVSLFAASYGGSTKVVICTAAQPCTPGFVTPTALDGGTSLSSPMFAGIQALIDQGLADKGLQANQGNAAPTLYALAAEEYGSASEPASTLSGCHALSGAVGTGQCVFHDITLGGNSTNCMSQDITFLGQSFSVDTPDCFIYQVIPVSAAGGAETGTMSAGLTSTSTTQYNRKTAAFDAKPGWDFANGLGSVDADNLFKAWNAFVHGR